jgi:hypothetical protein
MSKIMNAFIDLVNAGWYEGQSTIDESDLTINNK